MVHIIFLLTGLFVGFLSGMFGIGGGVIIFPIIYFCINKLMHIDQSISLSIAAASSLIIIIPTLSVAVLTHQKEKNIRWDIVKLMLPGIIIGVLISTIWLDHLMNPTAIKIIFTTSSILVALQIYLKKSNLEKFPPHQPKTLTTSIVGFLIGSLASLLGVAGGEYSASFLNYYKFHIKTVTATTSAIGLVISIAGTLGFLISGGDKVVATHLPFSIGYIYMPAVIQICITSLMMASIGARFAQKVKAANMRRYFALLIVVTGVIMPFM